MTEPTPEESWYPDTGLLAVLARLALLGGVAAVLTAVILPPEVVPDLLRSRYLEHFAAYYVVTVTCLAAMPRLRLRSIGAGVMILAALFESSHLASGAHPNLLLENWVADAGGVFAAVVPVAVDRFRRRFRPRNRT